MEGCAEVKHNGKGDKKNTKEGGRLAVSFEDSAVHLDDFDHVETTHGRSPSSEQPKLSKPQQFLSAWKRNSLQNKTISRIFGEPMHSSLQSLKLRNNNLQPETSDCDSDSLASCSFENESRATRGAAAGKKSRTTTSPTQRLEIQANDRDSISSNESSIRTEKGSRLSAIFDKARNKGRKLVASHKNKKEAGDTDPIEEACQVATVGQDVLCMEPESDTQSRESSAIAASTDSESHVQSSSFLDWLRWNEAVDDGSVDNSMKSQPLIFHFLVDRLRHLPFLRYRIVCLVVLLAISIVSPGFISGFLWGLYVSFVGFLYFFVSGPVNKDLSMPKDVVLNISKELEEQKTSKNEIYKGWMNELRGRYDSATYHVNNAQTVLVRLDGNLLRISRPERAVLKHAFHTDPTLTEAEPTICGQSIYDLRGAVVSLRPKRLAKRRWWSRKYPIHIRLASKESEISTSSALRRSLSVNEAIELAKLATTDDEGSDTDKQQVERKKKLRALKVMKISDEKDSEYSSQESSDEESQQTQYSKSGRANSADDVASFASEYGIIRCRGGTGVARGRSLYFFVRSAREKERWFHRLREACSQYSTKVEDNISAPKYDTKELSPPFVERRRSLPPTVKDANSTKLNLEYFLYVSNHVQFDKCISEVLKNSVKKKEKRTDGGTVCMDLGRNKWSPGKSDTESQLVVTANALAARIFYDFCRDAYWCKQVQDKIQSKLATIHFPYFIETLELSNLDLGTTAPEIIAVYAPILDDWGLWIDFELKYRGGIHLTLETKVNLMKLKEGMHKSEMYREVSKMKDSVRVHRYSDSDLPESPESSPDEDFGSKTEKVITTKESASKKFLNVVDKIASSNIFQGASELKPVKKMMEGISSTRLLLNVDVTHLEGTMTINIPPPPSDRLWYAFRTPPKLSIRSVPQVGDRSVDMTTVSSWIENKLRLLLEKNLLKITSVFRPGSPDPSSIRMFARWLQNEDGTHRHDTVNNPCHISLKPWNNQSSTHA